MAFRAHVEKGTHRTGATAILLGLLALTGHAAWNHPAREAGYPREHFTPNSSMITTSAPTRFHAPAGDDTFYIHHEITSGNAIGLSVYSNGFFGNNLKSRSPSMEYPVGSEQEHLVRAGLWVGGLYSEDGSFALAETLVSHATVDGYAGSSSDTESEFAPKPLGFTQRSTLFSDPFWSTRAESEQDLICHYIDDHSYGGPDHKPLHVRVTQSVYQFSFEPFDAIIIIDYTITNDDLNNPIFDLYAGFYAEFASGWKGGHEDWPPSGWFKRKDIAYNDSLRLLTERHFLLDDGNCPSWAGYALLGTRPDTIASKTVSFNWWDWDPGGIFTDTPNTDPKRYIKLSNAEIDYTGDCEAPNSDPVTLLSVGPLGSEPFIAPDGTEHQVLWAGDSVSVVFAMLGGIPTPQVDPPRTAQEDIAFNASWAQTYFDLEGEIPLPPPSPRLHVEASHSTLSLWWDRGPFAFIDPKSGKEDFEGFRVYVSEEGKAEGFCLVGEYDIIDTVFYNTGLDAITPQEPLLVMEGGTPVTYDFKLDLHDLRDGFKYWVSVTSFDTGSHEIAPLESGIAQNRTFAIPGAKREEVPGQKVIVFPNPYRGDAAWDEPLDRDRYLWFAGLPHRCEIRIYNLAGDLIQTIDFDADEYGATDVRGIYDPTDSWNPAREIPVLSGGMAAWDLTTRKDQAAATGLYVFSVKDLETGKVERGKFLIMK
ncbi:MAG: hypothetical protein KAY24_17570 [Candidatus Eisenbacteria sp.]|nr:hypothetical protein [Candidatus Eisenbacteria bacterium]